MDTIYYSMQEASERVSKCNSVVNLMVVFCLVLLLESNSGFQNMGWWDVITALLAK